MHGPAIIARTISESLISDRNGNTWQYHPRSDRHSKVACWAILFDLLRHCRPLAAQAAAGEIGFGINHEMRDFQTGRKKDLDLVICTPGTPTDRGGPASFQQLAAKYDVRLSPAEQRDLSTLPLLKETPVGEVHVALEAKACMTAHSRARPRLYDELSSSHLAIHGSSRFAIAVGFVMVNVSDRFISPSMNSFCVAERPPEYNTHRQPRDTLGVIAKVTEIQRRSSTAETGFDALGLLVVSCVNDGTPVEVVTASPSPQPGDLLHYDSMVRKVMSLYQARFPHR